MTYEERAKAVLRSIWPGQPEGEQLEHDIAIVATAIKNAVEGEIAALKDTVSELNRRCQRAESAAMAKVDEVRRSGPSLGRALAGWAAERYRKALEEIRQLVHPKGDEPRLEGCAGCVAERVLGSAEVKSESK